MAQALTDRVREQQQQHMQKQQEIGQQSLLKEQREMEHA